jgi:hypothetical protein
MRGKIAAISLMMAVASVGGSACAMNHPNPGPGCQVVGASQLPADAGGADAICSAIGDAARARVPGVSFTVEVRVLSASALAAVVRLADGRTLPEQKMAVSDRKLNPGSIGRFAAAIAEEIGKAEAR